MRFLRPRFQKMKPYHSDYLIEGTILNSNESPYPVPQALTDYMQKHLPELLLNRYPDTDSQAVIKAVTKAYNLEKGHVTCGVGSDELIDCILAAVLNEDDKVLMPYPSFSMYLQFTELNSGKLCKLPLTEDFKYDVEALKKAIKEIKPKVTFLCNPNNPTGCILMPEQIKEILEVSEGLVVVDEAYAEFCEKDISMIPYVNDYNHLIVLKTFSKAYALAGTRMGYAIACADNIDLIDAVKPPYNLNMFSQSIGAWAIEHREYALENARKIIKERGPLKRDLEALGLKTYDSEANFIWLEMKDSWFDALKAQKIYIRQMKVDDRFYYRITVGTPEENARLMQALRKLKEEDH